MPSDTAFDLDNAFNANRSTGLRDYYDGLSTQIPETIRVDENLLQIRLKSLKKIAAHIYQCLATGRSLLTQEHRLCAINIKATMKSVRTHGVYQREESEFICCELEKIKRALFLLADERDLNIDAIYDIITTAIQAITTRS